MLTLDAEAFQSRFYFQKKLGAGKFCVYLTLDQNENKQYALKAYPQRDKSLHECFYRESRFCKLSHPNVCKILGVIPYHSIANEKDPNEYSFLLLEYAPYGDFHNFFSTRQVQLSEALVRTYFHQLIDAIEYLHCTGIAHLDIKCENILIGEDFQLKIADFDLSQHLEDQSFESKGTIGYRAPEVTESNCVDFTKADIYSVGIVLFVMKSGGIRPHFEGQNYQELNFYKLLDGEIKKFWEIHQSFHNQENFYSQEFKELFQMMTEKDPKKRANICQIKDSNWYNGPVLSSRQLKTEMRYLYLA